MRASSVKTLASMVVAVDSGLGKASLAQGTSVAQEFLELSRLLESNVRLSRNLSDPARTAGDKQALARQIMGRSLSPLALSGVEALAAGRWSSEADLAKAARMLATHVLLKTALDNGQLEQTEREIFSLGQVITKNRDLRNFLTDSRTAAVEERVAFFNHLVASQVSDLSLRLVDAVIEKATPGHLSADVRALLDSAAQLRSQGTATVYSAVPLSPAQTQRLTQILAAQAGREVLVNVVVDPSLVGGLRIQRGDVMMDGTVSTRADEIRRKLAS